MMRLMKKAVAFLQWRKMRNLPKSASNPHSILQNRRQDLPKQRSLKEWKSLGLADLRPMRLLWLF